jgi:glycerol-3-phosphate acyltransferase PlsY
MDSPQLILAAAIGGYLIGSIPVAWLLAWAVKGEDLRRLGSGNVGVMNTAVSVARWAGLVVFLTEGLKGIVTVFLVEAAGGGEVATAVAVLAAVAGTRWPVWLRGAGGRGNTTGAGAILIIAWPVLVISLVVWSAVRLLTRSSYWATRINLLSWPIIFYAVTRSWPYTLMGLALAVIYLTAQREETDDHLIIKETWDSFWAFLTSPRRHN